MKIPIRYEAKDDPAFDFGSTGKFGMLEADKTRTKKAETTKISQPGKQSSHSQVPFFFNPCIPKLHS